MLNQFSIDWNNLYKKHPSQYLTGSAIIVEKDANAKNKRFTINLSEAVSFPSKQFNGYDMFGALTNCNCDGVLLVSNQDGTYDMLYIEMKSRFSSDEVFKAKRQIVGTYTKMQSLLQIMKAYKNLLVQQVIGIIETKELDTDQENWWQKRQMLPDNDMEFGELLLKYTTIEVDTKCKKELNMPEKMVFSIILSDKDNYTMDNYSVYKQNLTIHSVFSSVI